MQSSSRTINLIIPDPFDLSINLIRRGTTQVLKTHPAGKMLLFLDGRFKDFRNPVKNDPTFAHFASNYVYRIDK